MPARSALLDPLLAPIPGDNPSGRWVRDDGVYETIREARREEDDIDQGAWQRTRKVADPAQVIKLAGEVLVTTSKDLQLAAWWTEAMLKRDGAAGLRDGVALLRGLLDSFWETLYPELEGRDASMRAGPLDFVGLKLAELLRAAPMTAVGHSFRQYDAAQLAGTADEARDDRRRAAREAIDEKKEPQLETVLAAIDATPAPWYRALVEALAETQADVHAIDSSGDTRFGDDAPSFRRLIETLEQLQRVADSLLARQSGGVATESAGTVADARPSDAGTSVSVTGVTMTAPPSGDADAVSRVISAARFMRRARPADAVPYALLRALRWQELRTCAPGDPAPDASQLHAPGTSERTRLKSLMLEHRYEDALDAAEELLAGTSGGGWLDAQRFAIEAAAALGADFAAVHHAMQTALRQLLTTFPQLPHVMLLDDSATANAETLAWLERDGLSRAGGAASADSPLDGTPATPRRPMLERARAEAAGGRLDRGVALLMSDLARERSERARFLRRIEMATILVDGGRADIAMPILEDMLEVIDQHKLETWEDGSVVAQALVLACRAMDATDGDTRMRNQLYLRVCRLDPIAALTIAG